MPAAEASLVASSEPSLAKMDDRKRAANHDHSDSAPPLKKQATSVNGGSKPHPDADMPWKDDLDVSLLDRDISMAMIARILTVLAIPKRCDMAPDAGVQTRESIPGRESKGVVESHYVS